MDNNFLNMFSGNESQPQNTSEMTDLDQLFAPQQPTTQWPQMRMPNNPVANILMALPPNKQSLFLELSQQLQVEYI
jgi:hypothetical protein